MTEPTRSEHAASTPSVAVVNARLKTAVEDRMRGEIVRVRGVVWDLHRSQCGHTYFRLRHGRYALSCAVFQWTARADTAAAPSHSAAAGDEGQ